MRQIFYHLIDMAATKVYILNKRIKKENQSTDKLLELPKFRESIAAGLVAYQIKPKSDPVIMIGNFRQHHPTELHNH